MTDDPAVPASTPTTAPASVPAHTPSQAPPERVHVTADPSGRTPVAPVVYAAGLVVLAVAVFFLWRYPTTPRRVADDSNRLTALQGQVDTLTDRLAKLEGRAAPDLAAVDGRLAKLEGRTGPDLAPLDQRIVRLETRTGPDLAPLDQRLARLESRPPPAPPPPVDLSAITGRIDALERDEQAGFAKRDGELTALRGRLDSTAGDLGSRIAGAESHVAAVENEQKDMGGLAARAQRTARVQAATAALDAGQALGPVPDAPAALARFATVAPPTAASLRLSFADAADAAHRASQPAITGDKNFLQRAWITAEQAVTVRQGDRVMLGDPIAGVLAHAKDLLDAGDLVGCLQTLGQMAGPAKAAMAGWIGQAQALLDARSALAKMAQG